MNSLAKARRDAQDVSNDIAGASGGSFPATAQSLAPADRILAVVGAIQQTYADFGSEREFYSAAARVDPALASALDYASRASSSAFQGQMAQAKSNLQKSIDYLELADVLMIHGNIDNAVDYAQYLVRQHYVDFLGREPDEPGRAFWTQQITACGDNAGCVEAMRVNVSAAYFLSIEFHETGYLAHRLYRASLGRRIQFNEFVADTEELGKGVVVGTEGWRERLAANKSAFFSAWVERPEFRQLYDTESDWTFVSRLFDNIGVTPNDTELDALLSDLRNGASRASVLARIVENEQFEQNELSPAFVRMQYFGYLRRDPDESGYNYWLEKLNHFGGNYVQAEMVRAFLSSIEYRDRFRQM